MKLWVTEYKALNAAGEIRTFMGDYIEAATWDEAQNKCPDGVKITGQLISEIPTMADEITPNWAMQVDYDRLN